MKKIMAIFLIPALCLYSMITACADGVLTVTAASQVGEAGGRVTIPVEIGNNSGFAGFTIDIQFDSSILTPVSEQQSELLFGGMFIGNTKYNQNTVRTTFAATSNISGNGKLYDLIFDISSDAHSGEYPITISYVYMSDDGYNPLETQTIDSVVKVNGTKMKPEYNNDLRILGRYVNKNNSDDMASELCFSVTPNDGLESVDVAWNDGIGTVEVKKTKDDLGMISGQAPVIFYVICSNDVTETSGFEIKVN